MQAVQKNRRKGLDSIPEDLAAYLNPSQLAMLEQMVNFGWTLRYVRRPLFMEPVPILYHPDMREHAVLEMDGSVNRTVEVAIRH